MQKVKTVLISYIVTYVESSTKIIPYSQLPITRYVIVSAQVSSAWLHCIGLLDRNFCLNLSCNQLFNFFCNLLAFRHV